MFADIFAPCRLQKPPSDHLDLTQRFTVNCCACEVTASHLTDERVSGYLSCKKQIVLLSLFRNHSSANEIILVYILHSALRAGNELKWYNSEKIILLFSIFF